MFTCKQVSEEKELFHSDAHQFLSIGTEKGKAETAPQRIYSHSITATYACFNLV